MSSSPFMIEREYKYYLLDHNYTLLIDANDCQPALNDNSLLSCGCESHASTKRVITSIVLYIDISRKRIEQGHCPEHKPIDEPHL